MHAAAGAANINLYPSVVTLLELFPTTSNQGRSDLSFFFFFKYKSRFFTIFSYRHGASGIVSRRTTDSLQPAEEYFSSSLSSAKQSTANTRCTAHQQVQQQALGAGFMGAKCTHGQCIGKNPHSLYRALSLNVNLLSKRCAHSCTAELNDIFLLPGQYNTHFCTR